MKENERICSLKGIGEKTEGLFHKLGVYTVGDLVRYFPQGYNVYEPPVLISELEENHVMTVGGAIYGKVQVGGNPKLQVTTLYVKDLTGTLKVIWFRMPFLKNMLAGGGQIILRGKVVRKGDGLLMEHPEIFYPSTKYQEKLDSLQPVYSLTKGLTNNGIQKAVKQALLAVEFSGDTLPENIRRAYGLMGYQEAMRGVHFPQEKEEFYEARARLVFEEFFSFILSLRLSAEQKERMLNAYCMRAQPMMDQFLQKLPFDLTAAQKNAWCDIKNDMDGIHVMSRLVQGDVGSGKTIVALLAMMYAGLNGCQAVMMAPTEVLARQHYQTFETMFRQYDVPLEVELLTGSMTAAQKRAAYRRIESGEAQIIVGTHALIQKGVTYRRLVLVVTDEQHRFGVRQRETLAKKGDTPHVLVMSATPIPRTLAIILYGDLDVSVINELPKNRLPIKNCVVDTGYRATAYAFMKKQITKGRQCYVICPMVEESDALEAENVTDYARNLQDILGESVKVGCLHGKMKQDKKDEVMFAFSQNEIQVLVSTTVIEVGIDVPNATVMLIENSERFGLAQLHQLRGRVGRGKHQSYCIFMTASKSKETKERLDILNHSNDGFHIASEDLRLRGPGDVFGIRQSGVMNFKLGDVYQDAAILQKANEAATEILQKDPYLKEKENILLHGAIETMQNKMNLETTL